MRRSSISWVDSARNVFLVFGVLLITSGIARASITIEVFFDDGALTDGTVAALVADTNQDGFLAPDDPTIPGTVLEAGQTVGTSDDIIVAILEADTGSHWNGGAGIADTAERIDYEALGIAPGTPLILYIFPDASQPGDTLAADDRIIRYRNAAPGGSGGDIAFQAPADSGVFTLSALSAANGGNFDPLNLFGTELYDEATIGGEDHGDTRATATWLTSAGLPTGGFLLDGDTDFFTFSVGGPSRVIIYTTGDTDTVGELQSANGSPLNDAAVDSDGGDDSNFRIDMTVSGGSFFVAVTGAGGAQPGAYNFVYDIIPLKVPANRSRPDATIGKSLSRQKGNDYYSQNGSKQELTLAKKKGTMKFYIVVGNDGTSSDTVAVSAKGKSKHFDVKYYQMGGGNVTGLVSRSGHLLNLSPRSGVPFKLMVKPTRRAVKSNRKRSQTYLVNVRSGGLADGVRAVATKK